MGSDLGTPHSHVIKDESCVIRKGWWFCRVLSSGLIDGCFGLNVGEIYPVLIWLLDVKYMAYHFHIKRALSTVSCGGVELIMLLNGCA